MPLILESVRDSQDGREARYRGEFRYDDVLADANPCARLEEDLRLEGFSIPGLGNAITSGNNHAVHAAFTGAGMLLDDMTVGLDQGGRSSVIRLKFTIRRPPNVAQTLPSLFEDGQIVAAVDAVRRLGNGALGAAASTEQISNAIGRIATSNNSENYRAFVEQMHREIIYGVMGVPERLAVGPSAGLISVDNYVPSVTPAPTPKPKTVSPFSIGLGQRSIEV